MHSQEISSKIKGVNYASRYINHVISNAKQDSNLFPFAWTQVFEYLVGINSCFRRENIFLLCYVAGWGITERSKNTKYRIPNLFIRKHKHQLIALTATLTSLLAGKLNKSRSLKTQKNKTHAESRTRNLLIRSQTR